MTELSLKKIYSGKVRDLYEIDDKTMLIVATDRLSAFDVILDEPIVGKGEILTQISNFWFGKLAHIMPNHFTGQTVFDVLPENEAQAVEKRAVVAKRLTPVKIEAVVRGYLSGSGWKEYQKSGTVCGIKLPENLREAEKLSEVIFTPSTKAEVGDHDENISFERCCEIIGKERAEEVRVKAIQLYTCLLYTSPSPRD
ncbi:phosphoribosylaminoimidazolesuccinocarboxamide synthase, partial [Kingella kingae]|uniref:phosphoribosylaminoimidazolesuccinocarboxamide synthase n=1 Tax=Kingella kingae TaxID=504 RepID=UPI00255015F3